MRNAVAAIMTLQALLALAAHPPLKAAEFYVSPEGNDAHPGTESKPFRTVEAARDAVRASEQTGGHQIFLRGGSYFIDRTIEFDERDSGTADAPNVVASFPGERARLVGGVPVPAHAMRKTTDESILNRIITPEARDQIYEIDLKGNGVTDYGRIIPHGFHRAVLPWVMEVTLNGKRLRMAQWPNEDTAEKARLAGAEEKGIRYRGVGSEKGDLHYIRMIPFARISLYTDALRAAVPAYRREMADWVPGQDASRYGMLDRE